MGIGNNEKEARKKFSEATAPGNITRQACHLILQQLKNIHQYETVNTQINKLSRNIKLSGILDYIFNHQVYSFIKTL